jgi:uncharacterized membrane protein YkoI
MKPYFLPAVIALSMASTAALAAQQPVPSLKEDKPGLAAQATITPDSATHLARLRVPRGSVVAREIEEEDGRLIYSFDMKVPGKSGIDEVNVDAKTAAIVGVEHEFPRAEARERKSDAKARPRQAPATR